MSSWAFVLAGVGASIAFAVSTHLKHLSAADAPDAQDLRPGAIGRFVRATLSHRLWLGGIVADVFGLALQIIALHLGPLAAVQPLLILSLLFALLLRQRQRQQLNAVEIGWAVLVVCALGGLLTVAGTAGRPSAADRGPAMSVGAAVLVVAVGCLLLGRWRRGANRGAAVLGVAVGAIYAVTAALLKALGDRGLHHPFAVLWSWQLYAVLAFGAAGLVLNQLAFQAGPLSASLPAIATVDPLLSVFIGVWVFDERIRQGVLADCGLTVLLLVLGGGVFQLARLNAAANATPTPT